ncbi:DUF3471 domain-containing protein [Bradyrhizobium oligotrophicum]|uniref:M56 family metallopeptidase n=1 Tax=Bradyrhizobium oligotrophicum TaxID=44255 RepID=UPI003EB84D34
MDLLLEAALRSFGLGAAVWAGLRLFRVANPRLELLVWIVVLLASMAMPALVGSNLITLTLHEEVPAAAIPLPSAPRLLPSSPALRPAPPAERGPALEPDRPAWETRDSKMSVASSAESAGAPAVVEPQPLLPLAGLTWRPNWRGLLFDLYLVISSVLLLRIALGVLFAIRLWCSASRVHEPLAAGDVRVSKAITSPVTFAGSVLLPADYRDWEPLKLKAVLGHERSHVRHLDFYTLLFATVHRALFWINPFAWYLCYRVAALAEMRSDDEAIEGMGDRTAYAEVLLGVANGLAPPRSMIAMMQAIVAQRLDRILDNDCVSERPALRKRVAAYGACCTVILLSAGKVGWGYLPLDVSWEEFTARRASGAVRAVNLSPERLDSYVGYYEADPAVLPDLVLTVTHEKQHLFVQRTGQDKVEVLPESERDFFYTDKSFEVSFIARTGARPIAMILHQNGAHIRAVPVLEAVARRASDLLEQRLVDQARTREAVPIDPSRYDRLVGRYRENPRIAAEITREGDRLFARYGDGRRMELLAEDDLHFFFKDADAQISFTAEANGSVNALMLHQGGRLWPAQRVPVDGEPQLERAAATVARSAEAAPELGANSRAWPSVEQIVGFYQTESFRVLTVTRGEGRLYARLGKQPIAELSPAADGEWVAEGTSLRLHFTTEDDGQVSGVLMVRNGKTSRLPRIGRLPDAEPDGARFDIRSFDAELAGNYQLGSDTLVRIGRDGSRLWVEQPGRAVSEIKAVGSQMFRSRDTGIYYLFAGAQQPAARPLIVFDPGRGASLGQRIDGVLARALEVEAVRRTTTAVDRFLAQKAAPGSEEILRDTITQLQSGNVDLGQLKQRFSDVLRVKLFKLRRQLQIVGALQQLRFAGVAADGFDLFELRFARATAQIRLLSDEPGVIRRLVVRWHGGEGAGSYASCDLPRGTPKQADALPIDVTFVNHTASTVRLYLLVAEGEQKLLGAIEPNGRGEIPTWQDRSILATGDGGACIGVVVPGILTRVTEIRSADKGSVLAAPAVHGEADPQSSSRLVSYMAMIREGRIDDTLMSGPMARNGRETLAMTQSILTRLGVLESIHFVDGNSAQGDRLRARFSNGQVDWRIVTAADGRIVDLGLGGE